MKKVIFILYFIVFLSSSSFSQIKGTTWGMSIDEVKSIHGNGIATSETYLIYKEILVGISTNISYIFAENKLVRIKYLFNNLYEDKFDHIDDYKVIFDLLIQKYGNAEKSEVIWKNEEYSDDLDNWGLAISLGHLMFYATWITDETAIITGLIGENNEIKHVVEYVSRDLGHLEKDEDPLDDF